MATLAVCLVAIGCLNDSCGLPAPRRGLCITFIWNIMCLMSTSGAWRGSQAPPPCSTSLPLNSPLRFCSSDVAPLRPSRSVTTHKLQNQEGRSAAKLVPPLSRKKPARAFHPPAIVSPTCLDARHHTEPPPVQSGCTSRNFRPCRFLRR